MAYGNLISWLCFRRGAVQKIAAATGISESDLIAGACGYRWFSSAQRAAIARATFLDESYLFDPFARVPHRAPSGRGLEKAIIGGR